MTLPINTAVLLGANDCSSLHHNVSLWKWIPENSAVKVICLAVQCEDNICAGVTGSAIHKRNYPKLLGMSSHLRVIFWICMSSLQSIWWFSVLKLQSNECSLNKKLTPIEREKGEREKRCMWSVSHSPQHSPQVCLWHLVTKETFHMYVLGCNYAHAAGSIWERGFFFLLLCLFGCDCCIDTPAAQYFRAMWGMKM